VADYLIAGGIGALTGVGELVARYRDNPSRALATWAALFYVVVNASASLAALGAIHTFGWKFGGNTDDTIRWLQILVAGFGAMALFRSSLFTVRVGEQDVPVGPSAFLQVLLSAFDRAVDRRQARARDRGVSKAMADVSFDRAFEGLPAYCLALMQNASDEEQKELGGTILRLQSSDTMTDRVKSLVLGLALMNILGEDSLTDAVKTLGDDLKPLPPQEE
jgi:hypothetical protein